MRIRKNFENIFRRVFINNFSFFFFFNIFESAFEARLTEGNFFFLFEKYELRTGGRKSVDGSATSELLA